MNTSTRECFVAGLGAFVAAFALSCGGAANMNGSCDVSTCGGCCDATGRCVSGVTELACGLDGVTCAACDEGEMCSAGVCKGLGGSGGGVSGTGGGSAGGAAGGSAGGAAGGRGGGMGGGAAGGRGGGSAGGSAGGVSGTGGGGTSGTGGGVSGTGGGVSGTGGGTSGAGGGGSPGTYDGGTSMPGLWWTYNGKLYGSATAMGRRDRYVGGSFLPSVYIITSGMGGSITMKWLNTTPGLYPPVGTVSCDMGATTGSLSVSPGGAVGTSCSITVISDVPDTYMTIPVRRLTGTFQGEVNGLLVKGSFDMPFS